MPRVVAVVPARDEAPRIAAVVRTLPSIVSVTIVVDDGSEDDTAAVAIAADPRVELVRHRAPLGVGAAIAAGYRRARALDADCAVVLAGDGQMDPRDLPALVAPILDASADYAKGDRFSWPDGALAFPLDRLLGAVGLSAATRLATGLSIDDSQCGFTAIGRRALGAIDWTRTWPGYGYPNDLLIRCAALGLRVVEVPVRPIYAGAPSRLSLRHLPPIGRLLLAGALGRLVRGVRGVGGVRGVRALARRGPKH